MKIERCKENPIIRPGQYDWRKCVTFNPGVIYENGRFLLYERAAGSLQPFQTRIGCLESNDGIHFDLVSEKPVFTPEQAGYHLGSVEDARVVKIDSKYYMTYAMQPYQFDCWPTGHTLPNYFPQNYKEWDENKKEYMITQSGLAISEDGVHFEHAGYLTPEEIDDRDVILFPEKINGKFALLRRPMQYVGKEYGTDKPGIWISYSDDLQNWSKPVLVAVSEHEEWEGLKIGAAATPVKTEAGWLMLYHGVDKNSVYRVGAMILDLNNPEKVIARTSKWIMEPEEYYEKVGLVIPNVVFPTGNVVVDGVLHIYYGCCDTCIALATVKIDDLVNKVLEERRQW